MSLLATANEMRELDRETIEEYGIPGAALMESAGAGTARTIIERWPDLNSALIVAGKGNNGGDGFVIARHLVNVDLAVDIILLANKSELKGDAAINMEVAEKMGIQIFEVTDEDSLAKHKLKFSHTGLIVDAIFGTGLSSEVKGLPLKAIEMINDSSADVVSVDIPSGLNADSGFEMPEAVKAELTCTYGLAKPGLVQYPGRTLAGELEVVDIGLPINVIESKNLKHNLFDLEMAEEILDDLHREPDAHKGDFGHILILAGSPGKTGAAALVGDSALRAGAGLVTIGVPASLNHILEAKTTEPMTLPLNDGGSGYLDASALKEIMKFVEARKIDAIALGPGLDTQPQTAELVFELLKAADVPFIIDADGLNILASDPKALKPLTTPAIITPHPGEMARLTGLTRNEIQVDRIGTARTFAEGNHCVVVLKGAATVTSSPDGEIYINSTGNPGMASAGVGDVLTGIIASFVGMKKMPHHLAAAFGVFIHGLAGDLASEKKGEISLIATDIIEALPVAFFMVMNAE